MFGQRRVKVSRHDLNSGRQDPECFDGQRRLKFSRHDLNSGQQEPECFDYFWRELGYVSSRYCCQASFLKPVLNLAAKH